MTIDYGQGKTEYGPGVSIELTGDEVGRAISAWLVASGVSVQGPRTIRVNGGLVESGRVYIDPSGFVITPQGEKMAGSGAQRAVTQPKL